ncbi:phenylacetate-CoA oxygenase/reductase subunit PaaK [Marivirga atlantica]|jgi:ring-1,2-phenylacetyl-CoA epoxidase subunit PaaE|uniref:2Fe-2S iron-sulfur cluster binding domain-containing protein n=1 Tax=Marivirga atlantica TaxID=1548457 RepID=A0A937AFU4_9BACT|nr:2Fe-2S iron-sulfur cluster-binding protein [Marivirga atlantica]MBL0764814.1 2Fe-2S iron-sulfur cluster binding domain-containing protein [Marivirga atlantica]
MAFNFFKKKDKDTSKKQDRYKELTVKEVIKATKDAIVIEFEKPDWEFTYTAGQFITLITDIEGESVRRAYSLCTSPLVDEYPAVSVKRVENGKMSNFLNDNTKAGDTFKVLEPMGKFTTEVDAEKKRHLIMFAGGSGITPMMGISKSILHAENDSIISLIYANRNLESVIFKKELDDLQDKFEGRMHIIHVLDDAPLNWQGESGLLNEEMLKKIFDRIPSWGHENTQYLMCGPEGMMKNVEQMLESLSIPKDNVYKESFVQGTIDKAQKETTEGSGQDYEVTVLFDDEEHVFTVPADKSILETALDKDIDLPFSCQSGLCTACRGKLLSGTMHLDEDEGLSDSEREEGYVLTCVGHPTSPGVKIQIG